MKTTLALALSASLSFPLSAQVVIDWATIGNAGNAAQSAANRSHSESGGDGYGAVGYTYRMSRNETTIAQYVDFLNAKAASDPYGLWNSNMASNTAIAGITRSGTSGSYTYSITGSGNRPITYVSWFDAARFANWLHNGQGGGDTEDGAYTLVGGQVSGTAPAKNIGASIWVPTENEWYKAAYYDPTHISGSGGYWLHANQSDAMTSNNFSNAGAANYYDGNYAKIENGLPTYLSDAGVYGTDSQNHYGINDMAGNVREWNDLSDVASEIRGMRGGHWSDFGGDFGLRSSYRINNDTFFEDSSTGFRLASIPEPSTFALTALFGIGCLVRRKRND